MTGGGRHRPRVVLAFVRHGANLLALGRAQSDLDETVALSVVRGFATYLPALDRANEVPAADSPPHRPHRASPYLFSDDDVTALIAATASLRTPQRRVTFATLIGMLSVTLHGSW